jgi:hypothetical protein
LDRSRGIGDFTTLASAGSIGTVTEGGYAIANTATTANIMSAKVQ